MTEGINNDKVTEWLLAHVPGFSAPIEFNLMAGGHSNLTFQCIDNNKQSCVLRRPPLGHVLESAHDMGREHKIIAALVDTDVPVAGTYGLCTDTDINGAPFYVMDYVDGLVPHDSVAAGMIPEHERHGIGLGVIDILTRLHKINPDDVGLGDLGRKEAYLTRQLKRWTKQWEASKTHEVPEMEETNRILAERMPEQIGATIVHGDFRIGNMIVKHGRIQAILDWELCTLGDPLADVGYLLNSWMSADEVEPGPGDQAGIAAGGFPSRDEICQVYETNTGRDLSDINYYRAFSHWRLAAIGQGVYKRYLVGAMGKDRDVDLDRQKDGVQTRAQAALSFLV
jgi:aminoglycoside phosphotransferase (APT) family kinase protein